MCITFLKYFITLQLISQAICHIFISYVHLFHYSNDRINLIIWKKKNWSVAYMMIAKTHRHSPNVICANIERLRRVKRNPEDPDTAV